MVKVSTDLPSAASLGAASPFAGFVSQRAHLPFMIAQLGQSLDGRIATQTGESFGLGSAPSLDHLHRLRAQVDAVVVGIGTVLADNPRLNVRRVAGQNPARVVLDARGQVPLDAACLAADDQSARRLVFRADHLTLVSLPLGVEDIRMPVDENGRFYIEQIFVRLKQLGFERVLIEGGAKIVSAALEAGLLDRLHLLVSPLIIGSGKTGLCLPPIHQLENAWRPEVQVWPLGEGEVLFDCNFAPRCA